MDARQIMRELETARSSVGVSKADLARRSRLPPETVRRLLTEPKANPTLETVLSMLRPLGLGLRLAKLPAPTEEAPADPERVRMWLAQMGAPLHGASAPREAAPPRPEYVLAEALSLARQDAAVARALPPAIARCRPHMDLVELRRLAVERRQERTLGFFLDLTAELSGDHGLARAARRLRPRSALKRASQFFPVRSRLERKLAEAKTPDVARRWNFRMNMSLDSFASMFRKAGG
jgi:DNA-binding phage protein